MPRGLVVCDDVGGPMQNETGVSNEGMENAQLAVAIGHETDSVSVEAQPVATESLTGWEKVALGGILIVGAILRFAYLDRNSVWFDEAFVALIIQVKWSLIPSVLRIIDTHPPLYYLLMKAWVSVVGLGDAMLRIPSAFFGLISVVLTYALMRQVSDKRISLISALLVSTAPIELWSGQNARMYAFFDTLILGTTLTLVLSVKRAQGRMWAAYAAIAALMIYTHDLAFLVLLAQGIWVVWYERQHLRPWLIAMAVVAILYAPWVPTLWYQVTHAPAWFLGPYSDKPAYLKLSDLFGLFAFGGALFGMPTYFFSNTTLSVLEQVLILLPFLLTLGAGVTLASQNRRWIALFGLLLAIPVGVIQLIALKYNAFFARWFAPVCPFYAMLLSEGAFALSRSIRQHSGRIAFAIISVALLYNLAGLDRYYFDPGLHPFQYRSVAARVAKDYQPTDLLLFGDQGNEVSFIYYFKEPAHTMKATYQPNSEALRSLGSRFHRVWFITGPPVNHPELIERALSALSTSLTLVRAETPRAYPWVYLFEARSSKP